MHIPPWLEHLLMAGCDTFFKYWPQPTPPPDVLSRCRIIAHRGAHGFQGLPENTLAAFQRALEAPEVTGLELDVRWTQDLAPVVFHDADLLRMFGEPRLLSSFSLVELKERFPLIPTLEEVIQLSRDRAHLMIEVKEEPYPELERQNHILGDLLTGWEPGRDFHILLLDPALERLVTFAPKSCFLLVAFFNVAEFSNTSLEQGFGGIGGHYLLIGTEVVQRHLTADQFMGTGYPKSKNALFRELNRGVEWIFTNDPLEVAALIREQQQRN